MKLAPKAYKAIFNLILIRYDFDKDFRKAIKDFIEEAWKRVIKESE